MTIYHMTSLNSEGFHSWRAAPAILGCAMDPFLSIEYFKMRQQAHLPRPQAGFCAITYVLTESKGAILVKDSLGGSYVASAGELVWTRAARGILHEETPLNDVVQGLKIHLNLSREKELFPPKVFYQKHPLRCSFGQSDGFLISGAWLNKEQKIDSLSSFVLAELTVCSEILLPTRLGESVFIVPLSGTIYCSEGELGVGQILHVVSEGHSIAIRADDARVAFVMGTPLEEEACFLGPFAMSDQLRNKVVAQRYLSGDLGVLSTQ